MKISPDSVNKRLQNVPIEKRVFLYDATLVIEYLNSTFMPMSFVLKKEAFTVVGPGNPISAENMNNPDLFTHESAWLSMHKLYEYYCMFRNSRGYTAPVENKYKFGIIIKKLLLPKNGWQFNVKRQGRAQLIIVGPIVLRSAVSPEVRKAYPVPTPKVDTVEVTPKDLNEIEDASLKT